MLNHLKSLTILPDKLYFTMDGELDRKFTYEEIMDLGLKDEDWIARSVVFSDECKLSVVKNSIELLKSKRKNTKVPHKIIAAATNSNEAKKICEMYNEQGVKAVAVHNELSQDEKERAFNDIENHRVDVVVNVSMMGGRL